MARRSTIKDVAQRAGYSITTVSLVLNDKPASIPQSTREKIWRVADELNYRPNQLAVGMVTKRSGVLGLILPDNTNLFFASISKVVEECARQEGYALIYGNTSNDPKRDLEYIRMFSDRQVDGIIYTKTASFDLQQSLSIVQDLGIPFVTLDRQIPGDNVRSVVLNDFKGGQIATRHLLELGHRRIACMTGPMDISTSGLRLEGYRSALTDAGIPFDEALLFEGDYTAGHEKTALDQFCAGGATAIFCFNDIMAMGFYREARRRGLHIPRDLSVVGFDNIPFVDLIQPALTTVSQPIEDIGACVVRTLKQLIEGDDADGGRKTFVFEPELVIRESTATVRSGR